MDPGTIAVSVLSSIVAGGGIGGVVALVVARRESQDRQDALGLEREKWEHERAADSRGFSRSACEDALGLLVEADEVIVKTRNLTRLIETDHPDAPALAANVKHQLGSLHPRFGPTLAALAGTHQEQEFRAVTAILDPLILFVFDVADREDGEDPGAAWEQLVPLVMDARLTLTARIAALGR